MTEVKGILNAYPHVEADLYYADVVFTVPGVSIHQKRVQMMSLHHSLVGDNGGQRVAIYLTDGCGVYPTKQTPVEDPLWVVPDGGLESQRFPFGEVTRIQAA